MNIFKLINKGIRLVHHDQDLKVAEDLRAQWLAQLDADILRAWWNVSEIDKPLLSRMGVKFTLAGMCYVFDTREVDSVSVRMMRAAMSLIEQVGNQGSVLDTDNVKSLEIASLRAKEVIGSASPYAIVHAATTLRKQYKL